MILSLGMASYGKEVITMAKSKKGGKGKGGGKKC